MMKEDKILRCFKEVEECNLTDQQRKFVKSMRKWYKQTGELSDKQLSCLCNIYYDCHAQETEKIFLLK